tara:strand:- start:119 stop:1003 length:885 start_codon:yes stop_codon:yes gene_type:complete
MSWLYSKRLMDSVNLPCSREPVEEYSEAKCLDGEQCALWNGTHTQQASWLPAKTTKHSTLSRSGLTYKPLTDDLGEAVLMSFLEDFPAKTYPVQEKEPALTESEAVCGDTWRESSMKFDLNTSSWKTHQCLWDEDLPESSVTLPRWGMMRDGVLWERTTLPLLTSGTGSGLWHTPRVLEIDESYEQYQERMKKHPNPKNNTKKKASNFTMQVKNPQLWPTPRCFMHKDALKDRGKSNLGEVINEMEGMKITGQLNPNWVEWLMGWPTGWTDLNALETDKFLMWPHTHGNSLEDQ